MNSAFISIFSHFLFWTKDVLWINDIASIMSSKQQKYTNASKVRDLFSEISDDLFQFADLFFGT